MDPKKPDLVEEPDASYRKYSYADYLTWQFEEVVELINGKIFKKAAAAPKRLHQKVSSKLNFKLYQFLEGKRFRYMLHLLMFDFPKIPRKIVKFSM
jgi:hypothetical protein